MRGLGNFFYYIHKYCGFQGKLMLFFNTFNEGFSFSSFVGFSYFLLFIPYCKFCGRVLNCNLHNLMQSFLNSLIYVERFMWCSLLLIYSRIESIDSKHISIILQKFSLKPIKNKTLYIHFRKLVDLFFIFPFNEVIVAL